MENYNNGHIKAFRDTPAGERNTRPEEFERFINLLPEELRQRLWLIPIVANGKEPDVPKGRSWKEEEFRLSIEEALQRLREGKNVAVVAYPGSLSFIDNDDPENFPSDTLPATLTVKTRDGGFQYYYLNKDIEKNAVLKNNGVKVGELRANAQYVLAPGSYVPPSDEAFEGATGVYEIINPTPPVELSTEALPEWVRECLDGRKTTATVKVGERPQRGEYVNDLGIPLDVIRRVDEKLDELLSDLNPGYPSRSEADLAAASKLWFWRFDESDIADILRTYRPYEKTQRDDYLELTISKVVGGERFDPLRHRSLTRKLQEHGYLTEIELPVVPRASQNELATRLKEYGLDKLGITVEDLEDLAVRVLELKSKENGDIEVRAINHGAFAEWLREHFHFVTNSITEEIWRYDDREGVWKPDGESFLKSLIERLLCALGHPELASIRRVAEIIHHIKRFPQIHPREFNKAWRDGWLNCKNGVINIYTGEFRPHTPDFLFTWRINARYDPDAKSEILEYFLSTVVSPDQRELLEEVIAYCLVPGQPFKKLFVFHGPRDSGKSTTIDLITNFLGKENVSAVPLQELEEGRFALAELWGKLANCFADLPPDKLKRASRIKAITGGDELPIERKFRDMFFAKIDAKLIFSANRLPPVDESDAFWSRVAVLNFLNRFERNEDFKRQLLTDETFSALLNICLKAIPRLFEKKFEVESVENVVRMWKLASDPLAVFLEEGVEIVATADDDEVPADIYEFKVDVFDAFQEFCETHGVENPYPDFNTFVRAFNQKVREIYGAGLVEGRKEAPDGKLRRVWYGIRLIRPDDNTHDNNDDEEGTPPSDFSLEAAVGITRTSVEDILSESESAESRGEEKSGGETSTAGVNYVCISLSEDCPEEEIVSVDGRVYRLKPGTSMVLPEANAAVLEERGLGRIYSDAPSPPLEDSEGGEDG